MIIFTFKYYKFKWMLLIEIIDGLVMAEVGFSFIFFAFFNKVSTFIKEKKKETKGLAIYHGVSRTVWYDGQTMFYFNKLSKSSDPHVINPSQSVTRLSFSSKLTTYKQTRLLILIQNTNPEPVLSFCKTHRSLYNLQHHLLFIHGSKSWNEKFKQNS